MRNLENSLYLDRFSRRGNEFDLSSLFANGEVGFLADLSNLSTLYQNATGTTPASVGDSGGLVIDQSQGGLSALSAETVANGDFSNGLTGWTQNAAATGAATVVNDKLVYAAPHGDYAETKQANASVVGKTYKVTFDVTAKVSASTTITIQFGRVAIYNASLSGLSIGTHSAIIKSTHTDGFSISVRTDGEVTIDNISAREVPGNHAIQDLNADKRPILQQDAGGFKCLDFDGVDDTLYIPSLDLTGTDKITVFVALRKLDDLGNDTVVETSAGADAYAGAFYLRAPSGGASNYQYRVTGTTNYGSITPGVAAPDTSVLTLTSDLAAGVSTLRRNGVLVGTSAGVGGSFGNYPVYIGGRTGSYLFFGGRIYGLIIRGAASTDDEIAKTEAYLAKKCGVTL